MSRYLIIGGSGTLGRAVLGWLWPRQDEVYTVGRHEPGRAVTRHYVCDLEGGGLPADLPGEVDHILYLASSEKYRDFPAQAPAVFAVGTAGVMSALDYGRRAGAKSFVLASSGAVSATTADLKFYALTKRMAEHCARAYSDTMAVRVLRPYYIYGKGQRQSALIPRLIERISAGLPVFLQGMNGPTINPIHATDAAAAFVAATQCEGITDYPIDICGMHRYTIRAVAEIVGNVVGREPVFSPVDGAPVDTCGDPDDMLVNLHEPSVDLADGIAGMVDRVLPRVAWA